MAIASIPPYPMPEPGSLPPAAVDWRADPGRAALLLHDVQEYFLRPFRRDRSPARELLANAARLRERARAAGVPVLYSVQPGDMSRAQRGLLRDFWGSGMSSADHDVRVVAELAPAEDDHLVTKWRYSAFTRSRLGGLMRRLGRDQLLVCGVYAQVGCLVTAVDAFSRDIQPFLVADAVADFTAEGHRLALEYAASRCAAVVSTDRLCAMLETRSAT
ncbi:isochorismatase family protein [Saccharothrix sp. NPDC042600]|uniref:isochorismatase family protein n=1 Tax=Saccharothrix TaxID=2071 RepID=UPI0033C0997F|nr:hypothetical protein GCM10017745_58360 [Saccharothrix mutabilis subsp. capreolus]